MVEFALYVYLTNECFMKPIWKLKIYLNRVKTTWDLPVLFPTTPFIPPAVPKLRNQLESLEKF